MEYLSSPDIILFLQQFKHTLLDYFFIAVTFLGNEEFFLVAIPVLYWCVEKEFAFKLGMLFLLSAYINDLSKWIFQTPRPDPSVVRVLYPESGGGWAFPSGHAQGAVVFWGAVAHRVGRWWMWLIAGLLMLLIGISRLYLGVHWPIDVVGGWLIGLVLLAVYILYEAKKPFQKVTIKTVLLIAAVILFGALLLVIYASDITARVVGTLMGMATGYILEQRYFPFEPRSAWWHQIVKVVVGIAVVFAIKVVLKKVFPDEVVFHVIRYFLIGLWIGAGVPFFFRGKKAPA